jgi:hypothetical protein
MSIILKRIDFFFFLKKGVGEKFGIYPLISMLRSIRLVYLTSRGGSVS